MYRGALGVVLHFCRATGVIAFQRGDEYRVSSFLAICAKLFVTITAISFIAFASTYLWYDEHGSLFSFETLQWVSILFVILAAFVSVFTSSKRTLRLMRLLKKLDKIDSQIMGDCRKKINERKLTALILIYLHGSLVIRCYDLLLNVQSSRKISSTALQFMVLITFYMVNLLEVQLILFFKRTMLSLKLINDSLEKIYKRPLMKDISQKHIIKNHLLAWDDVNEVQSVRARSKPGTTSDKTITENIQEPAKYIRQCAANYMEICNIISTSTDGDASLIVILMIYYILHLLSPIYKLIVYVITPVPNASVPPLVLAMCWFVIYSVTLIAFAEPIHKTHSEMQRLQLLLTSLILKNLDKEDTHNELQLFWRVINLDKPTYAPLGLFNMNRSLSVKIFGTLITYLVIIVTYGPETNKSSPSE